MNNNYIKTIISALLITLITVACVTSCAAPSSASGNEKITVVLDWLPNTNHTGLYVALEKGYFKENGLDIEITQPPESGALPLIASGKAQFAVSFQEEIAAALSSEQPLDVKAVAAVIQHNTSGILSLTETGITSPKQMEGMRYASWDTPLEKAILKSVVTKDGGDIDKVQFINNTVTDVISALKTDIDAVWVFYAWDGIAAEILGEDVNYFAFKDIDPVLDFYTPVLAAGSEFLSESPETAKKFLEAAKRGYEYAIDNPDEAAEILVKYAPETDIEIAKASQQYLKAQYKAEVGQWGYIDPARWNDFYDWMYQNGLVEKDLNGWGFTNDFLSE